MKHVYIAAAVLIGALSTAACGTLKGSGAANVPDAVAQQPANPLAGFPTNYGPSADTVQAAPSIPATALGADAPAPEPKVLAPLTGEAGKIAAQLAGEWIIVRVGDTNLPVEDEMPYITFDAATRRFYASNGCNVLNGDYTVNAKGQLLTNNVGMTMRMCPDTPGENQITRVIGGTDPIAVQVTAVSQDSYLTMTAGGQSIVARKHNMEFLNGQWQIVQLNGRSINDPEVNIFIDVPQLKIHGNTGCNYFNGTLYLDPTKAKAVEFGEMGVTRMACPKMEQEQQVLLALESVKSAQRDGKERVNLLNAQGQTLIKLKKMPVVLPEYQ